MWESAQPPKRERNVPDHLSTVCLGHQTRIDIPCAIVAPNHIRQIHVMLQTSFFRCPAFSLELGLSLFPGNPSSVGSSAPRVVYPPCTPQWTSLRNTSVHAPRQRSKDPKQFLTLTFDSLGFAANSNLRSINSGFKSYLERSRGFKVMREHPSSEFGYITHLGLLDGRSFGATLGVVSGSHGCDQAAL
jgi:hypothetical protein